MKDIEMISFNIISNVGMARASSIEAIDFALDGDFEKANEKIEEGHQFFLNGHHAHAELIQMEANGDDNILSLLLVHAEDQLMSAENFKILADRFIKLGHKINK